MTRIFTTGRGQLGLLLIGAAAVLLVVMAHYTTAPGPTLTDAHQGAAITFSAAHPAVWRNTGCVDLTWRLSNISEVYLNDVATVGEQVEAWCLPPPASYRGFYRDPAPAELRVRFNNGEIRRYTVRVYAMQPFIERIVVPLVLAGLLAIGSLYLPWRVTDWLSRPRPLPVGVTAWLGRHWRRWAIAGLLAAALVMTLYIAYRLTLAPPYAYTTGAGEARLTITVDPPVVLRGGDCTTLAWSGEGITALTLDDDSVPTAGEMQWCLPPRASNSIPQFEIETAGGETHRRTIYIAAMLPVIGYSVLPLLAAAATLMRIRRRWHPAPPRSHLLLTPFIRDGQLDVLLLAVFMAINALVVSNVFRHNAGLAHDGEDHFLYSLILADGRLPTAAETNQFFAPPLVYVVPAIVHRAATAAGLPPCSAYTNEPFTCRLVAKTGQAQNIVAAIGITYLLLLICRQVRPQDHLLHLHTLLILGTLPVFQRSMVYQRGEPFVALFTLLVMHRLLVMLPTQRKPTARDAWMIGLGFGLLALSRQWGVFAGLGIGLWALLVVVQRGRAGLPLLRTGTVSIVIAAVSGGWFYLLTAWRNGSVTAFNREAELGQQAANFFALKPLEFYIGLGSGTLFEMPFRAARIAQVIPIFYTEMWGDYWGMFYLPSTDFSVWTAAPPPQPIQYMAWVNVLSLLPTAVLLLGLAYGVMHLYDGLRGRQEDTRTMALFLATCVVLVSLIGYGWFLIKYPHSVGDTIKAMYVLQIFPLLSMLTGAVLVQLRHYHGWAYTVLVGSYAVVTAHNLAMLVTNFTG